MNFKNLFDSLIDRNRPIVVALSGGVDSIVLAHEAQRWAKPMGIPLLAIHVHHGLSGNADEWAKFVERFCETTGINLKICRVVVNKGPRESLEDIARKARYEALLGESPAKSQILLGHHLDDQLETILLGLKRGAGSLRLKGISSRVETACSRTLVRPLLEHSKMDILEHAQKESLSWVEDESNADSCFDRNFLRNEIIPLLKSRWNGFLTSVKRTSRILSDEQEIIQLHGEKLLSECLREQGLSINALSKLKPVEIKLTIRHWIISKGLPGPREDKTLAIYDEVAMASNGRHPEYRINGGIITRKKGHLVLNTTGH